MDMPVLQASAAEPSPATSQPSDDELIGLWMTEVSFGPVLRGELVIRKSGAIWHASLARREADCTIATVEVWCIFPNRLGAFRGLRNKDKWVDGWWLQPTGESEDRQDP